MGENSERKGREPHFITFHPVDSGRNKEWKKHPELDHFFVSDKIGENYAVIEYLAPGDMNQNTLEMTVNTYMVKREEVGTHFQNLDEFHQAVLDAEKELLFSNRRFSTVKHRKHFAVLVRQARYQFMDYWYRDDPTWKPINHVMDDIAEDAYTE